jgi:hypothetical protein
MLAVSMAIKPSESEIRPAEFPKTSARGSIVMAAAKSIPRHLNRMAADMLESQQQAKYVAD